MSPMRSSALVLLVCAVVTWAADCPAVVSTTRDTTNYTLSTSPSVLTNGTVYTVTFASTSQNATAFLQVLANNVAIGTWSSLPNGFSNCTDAIWSSSITNNTQYTANWTSPATLNSNSVTFRALINDSFGQSKVDFNVTAVSTSTASPNASSTATMSTGNSTAINSTASTATGSNSTASTATGSNSTATSTASSTTVTTRPGSSTTNAGPRNRPIFFTLMEALIFCGVLSKLLS